MRKRLTRPLAGEFRTALLLVLWTVSVGWIVLVFGLAISATSFFGGSLGDGLWMAFENQFWQSRLSLSSVPAVALIHLWLRKAKAR